MWTVPDRGAFPAPPKFYAQLPEIACWQPEKGIEIHSRAYCIPLLHEEIQDFVDEHYPEDAQYASSAQKIYAFCGLFAEHLPEGMKPRLAHVYVPCDTAVWRAIAIVIATNRSAGDRELGRDCEALVHQLHKTYNTTNAAGWYFIASDDD